jgi:xylulose-5-phosphate/fructose-6-phosphate phosphoketolase
MPGEVIDRPDPEPLPSHLPQYVAKLQISLPRQTLDEKVCDALLKFRRAASYIAAGM